MPKLVQKCGYIKSGSGAGYMKYIATREGVEKLHGRGEPTEAQKCLIQKLLRDFPDSAELCLPPSPRPLRLSLWQLTATPTP